MEDVKNVNITPLEESIYVRPYRMHYVQDGRETCWDLLEVHDSVAILLFNITRRKLIFVKQFRPAVYYNCIDVDDRDMEYIDTEKYPASLGVTLEICAGIVDKDKSLEEIACEEVLEECGYLVQPKQLKRVMSYRSGVGVQGSEQVLFYCEVTDAMKKNTGGGVGDELIEVVEMSIPETERWLTSPPHQPTPSPPSCLYALMWFLHYHADKYRK